MLKKLLIQLIQKLKQLLKELGNGAGYALSR